MTEFVQLTVDLIKEFQEGKASLKFLIVDTIGIRGIFESVYNTFVGNKEMLKLTDLPVEEKNRLWLLVSNVDQTRTVHEKISSCKCLHLIEQILAEKITKL